VKGETDLSKQPWNKLGQLILPGEF